MNYLAKLTIALVAVFLVGCPRNQPPIVSDISASPREVAPKGQVNLSVSALDPEKGKLEYAWQASAGSITSFADGNATWTAPDQPGSYAVQVSVSDKLGATATKMMQLQVTQPPPPATRTQSRPRARAPEPPAASAPAPTPPPAQKPSPKPPTRVKG